MSALVRRWATPVDSSKYAIAVDAVPANVKIFLNFYNLWSGLHVCSTADKFILICSMYVAYRDTNLIILLFYMTYEQKIITNYIHSTLTNILPFYRQNIITMCILVKIIYLFSS